MPTLFAHTPCAFLSLYSSAISNIDSSVPAILVRFTAVARGRVLVFGDGFMSGGSAAGPSGGTGGFASLMAAAAALGDSGEQGGQPAKPPEASRAVSAGSRAGAAAAAALGGAARSAHAGAGAVNGGALAQAQYAALAELLEAHSPGSAPWDAAVCSKLFHGKPRRFDAALQRGLQARQGIVFLEGKVVVPPDDRLWLVSALALSMYAGRAYRGRCTGTISAGVVAEALESVLSCYVASDMFGLSAAAAGSDLAISDGDGQLLVGLTLRIVHQADPSKAATAFDYCAAKALPEVRAFAAVSPTTGLPAFFRSVRGCTGADTPGVHVVVNSALVNSVLRGIVAPAAADTVAAAMLARDVDADAAELCAPRGIGYEFSVTKAALVGGHDGEDEQVGAGATALLRYSCVAAHARGCEARVIVHSALGAGVALVSAGAPHCASCALPTARGALFSLPPAVDAALGEAAAAGGTPFDVHKAGSRAVLRWLPPADMEVQQLTRYGRPLGSSQSYVRGRFGGSRELFRRGGSRPGSVLVHLCVCGGDGPGTPAAAAGDAVQQWVQCASGAQCCSAVDGWRHVECAPRVAAKVDGWRCPECTVASSAGTSSFACSPTPTPTPTGVCALATSLQALLAPRTAATAAADSALPARPSAAAMSPSAATWAAAATAAS